ncbi:hypothetical protein V498_06935 [Pseudogymnoascus sp. VKM F-4517 (FW-2822)]|nr:hypothetical protein V498_06935 [Pseudogymnoascus sp. VKM F-4517 (FW-2822)]
MAILTLLTTIWAALAAPALAAKANTTYPATIEIDLLFPRNATYNSNHSSIPIVLGIQNVQAAYAYEWSIHWSIYGADSPADSIPLRGLAHSRFEDNEFQYYFNDVAVVPMSYGTVVSLRKGGFRLEWDYAATPCIPEGESSIYGQTRTPIASGTEFFSVVEDGSGLDFDIPIGEGRECPSFGDAWSLEDKEDCPAVETGSEKAKGEPCGARLTSQDQVDCIWEYLSLGKNETETCTKAFERADPDWPKYYTPGSGGGGDGTGGDGEDDGSGSNGTDTSTGTEDSNGDANGGSAGDSKEDAGVSHRPILSGLALAVFGAVVMAM